MRKPIWMRMLFVFSVIVFVCLLLCGGSRLIASPEGAPLPSFPPPFVKAALTCPPNVPAQTLHESKTAENKPFAFVGFCQEEKETAFFLPQTDANGNILRHTSYMRAVYQVFALGDGFA